MKNYEAYIHANGSLMVKAIPEWNDSTIDQRSPHVLIYLGKKKLPSLNQARAYFRQLNGGRSYVDPKELLKNKNIKSD